MKTKSMQYNGCYSFTQVFEHLLHALCPNRYLRWPIFSGEVGRMEAKDLLKANSILLATYGCIIMTVQIEVDSIQSV